ncbi:diaminopimelate epimerase [Candidatus Bandiella numerosa]|uniref:diaminopimelate epimerase n=1 Tax=Candidatus Bandiella numerosa TaxID=2570586 RepID=UPI001F02A670|nr:diaminopimelate epimerase [Candidatus Bandiella numerosa]
MKSVADFYKYHGLGNDYIVIDPNKLNFNLKLNEENIRLICHRNYGIGSDGILFGPIIKNGKISFQIFNPDGSEAEKSGNGIRIFALYIHDQEYIKENKFELYTKGGMVGIDILDLKSRLIKVAMGEYSFLSEKIPMNLASKEVLNHEINLLGEKESISCVNIGNTHCVLFKKNVTEDLAKRLGPLLENHELFPNKTNVQFVQILDRANIKIEIWERGAGYTLASGTSSSAASCVAHKLGFVDKNVIVHMKGGNVGVEITDEGLFLTGEVARISSGDFAKDFIEKILK